MTCDTRGDAPGNAIFPATGKLLSIGEEPLRDPDSTIKSAKATNPFPIRLFHSMLSELLVGTLLALASLTRLNGIL
jgi:hypothetical protein